MQHVFLKINISVQFVEIKCAEHDHTLQTVNTEIETTSSSFGKLVTNICFYHVNNVNTRATRNRSQESVPC